MIKIGLTDYTPSDKIIEICDKNQIVKVRYAISATDVLKYTLMSEHYIEISFEFNQYVAFKRSDYILWNGSKFTLREDYLPEQENKYKYNYTLKFEATEMLFQDIQFYYLNQSLKESEWRLAGNPQYFIKIAVDNANRYFNTTEFNMGTVEPTDIKDITFDLNTNTFDALTQIAETYEAEWYMTGKTIHLLNKVSFGDEIDFESEVSVLSMDRQEGESTTKYTRIVALGSTRNIPKDYRATTAGEAVDAIYPKRLRIPAGKGDVIDAYPNMSPDEVVEGTVIFDEVYPRREGTIEAVGTIEYQDVNEDTGEVTKWNAYKFKDSGINFKKEYLLPGQELKLQFTSGDLNGRDFALIFHEKGFSSTDDSQFYEIVRTDEFGKLLPNDIMKPKAGNKYVLYGFNIALVSDQYVPAAEQELFEVATQWQQKQLADTSVYECPTVIKHFKDKQMDLAIGQKVRLVFDDKDRSVRPSRIMGFEKKLYNIYDATYTVGDNAAYSRIAKIEQQIKELQYAGVVYENTGGNGVYIIKQFDTTTPTDFNVYSAKASDAKYFNKQTGGSVAGDTLFQKNMQVQGFAISDVFQNSTFNSGALGSGFQIKQDANGSSYLETDYITARKGMTVHELTIDKIKSIGGSVLLSLASMEAIKVEDKGTYWRCFFDNDNGNITNDFQTNDQAICQVFTGRNIKRYWRLVVGVGSDYIDLSKTDKDQNGESYDPEVGDQIIQFGNRTDVNRQSARLISTHPANSDVMLEGVNSYDLTGKETTYTKAKSLGGSHFDGSFTISTNGTTAPVYKDRNLFLNGTLYYLNDRVSHLGSYWVCIVGSTIQTPHETSLVWRKETVGKTDIDNAIGTATTQYQSELRVLDDRISTKVAQTDFDALGNRVSTTESHITQLSGSITSVVETVNNIEIGGENLLLATKTIGSGWSYGAGTARTPNDYMELTSISGTIPNSGYLDIAAYAVKNLEPDSYYTFSMWVKGQNNTDKIVTHLYPSAVSSGINSQGRSTTSSDGYILTNVSTQWNRIWITYKTSSDIAGNKILLPARISSANGTAGNKISICGFKLEKGNKVTPWSPAIADIETSIDSAQTTADSKNRTHYQDAIPATPSGGHKTGDIWYKTSLVDSSGNVNTDTTKNVYQLQYRWNGTTWVQINWSASKSKIEQTDSRITSIVESTGIDSLGNGETLYSKINQTNTEISLAVGKIKTGSDNLLNDSQSVTVKAVSGSSANLTMSEDLIQGETYTLSYDSTSLVVTESYPQFYIWKLNDWASLQSVGTIAAKTRTFVWNKPTGRYTFTVYSHNYPQSGTCNKLKLEKGNMDTPWTPSREDTLNEIGSKLTITDNKISLASTTIKLTGDTIAKSIKAGDLKVGSRTGTSALEVLKDGTFYAKGSGGTNQSLVIDSGNQSIKIVSPSSYNGAINSDAKSTIQISPEAGGIRVSDDNVGVSAMSSLGIIANKAGMQAFSSASGIGAFGAVVGLGNGNMVKDYRGTDFIAGVIGIAENSNANPAPAYGGWFQMLRANGLTLNTIIISNTSSINTNLSSRVSLVVSTSSSQRNIYLPSDAYQGTVIWFKQWYSGFMRIYPPSGYKLFDDNSENTYLDIGHGETAMCICLTDVTVSGSKIWLFGKFKF